MKLARASAEIWVPDGRPGPEAVARITHLGIGAHQDDLEFMALHGILECYSTESLWFGGVTCTDGGRSARSGAYAACTDEEMRVIRRKEQNKAAGIGKYGVMIQLDYASESLRSSGGAVLLEDLAEILRAAQPQAIYTHNLLDKHETHVCVALAVIRAIRAMPAAERPEGVYGCEVWRSLDWMNDEDKVIQDVSGHEHLAAVLARVFKSQIAGGKRYDLAVAGRLRANATFQDSHEVDKASAAAIAMDLGPLIRDETLDIAAYAEGFIERFRGEAVGRLRQLEAKYGGHGSHH